MRQAGVLAAAGLYALHHHRARLAEDHDNAGFLSRELARIGGLAVSAAETNIVMVDLPTHTAAELVTRARGAGLLFGAVSARRFRLVTHLDVDRAACARAVEILTKLVR